MTSLGFENYAEALKIYLSKFREVCIPCSPCALREGPLLSGRVVNLIVVWGEVPGRPIVGGNLPSTTKFEKGPFYLGECSGRSCIKQQRRTLYQGLMVNKNLQH